MPTSRRQLALLAMVPAVFVLGGCLGGEDDHKAVLEAAAGAGCDLYTAPAASGGSDANPGTKAQPKESPFVLLAALAPGETGCLEDGASFQLGRGAAQTTAGGAIGAPKTLRPETPGSRATIVAATGYDLKKESHDLVLKDLNIRTGATSGSMLQLNGDRLTLDGIDATYPHNICIDIGDDPRPPASARDSADDIVIRNSRIHGCGGSYGPPKGVNDSGVHGIYVQFARRLLIEDNYIYANHNRGIQLYPDADSSIIRRNVLYGNGANLNIGSERGAGLYSQGNLIENNVLRNSVLSGLAAGGFVGDTSEVLGNWPGPGAGIPAHDNVMQHNCISNSAHPGELYEGAGFTQTDNHDNEDPRLSNPTAGDFSLLAGSPCAGKVPTGEPDVPAPSDCAQAQASSAGVVRNGNTVQGTAGNDVLVGSGADETLNGAGGDDLLCGGEGFDTLAGGPGDDELDGQGGSDGVEYAQSSGAVSVDLAAGRATGEGTDTLISISEAYGSPAADLMVGDDDNTSREALFGAGGDDTLRGQGGDDSLAGHTGDDTVDGGAGLDDLNGGEGADAMLARDGEADEVACGPGSDSTAATDPSDITSECESVDDGSAGPTPHPPPDDCAAARAALAQARGALRRARARLRRAPTPKPRKLKRAVASAARRVAASDQAAVAAC